MVHADACHNLSGACACRHIDDGRAGKDLTFGGLIVFRDCGDDWKYQPSAWWFRWFPQERAH